MKIKMNLGIVKTILIAVVLAGGLAIIGLDISMLVKGGSLDSTMPAVAGASMVAATIIVVIALLILLNSYYKFEDNRYLSVLGFFVDKIEYDKIVGVKQNAQTKELFVLVEAVGSVYDSKAYKINIATKETDNFLHLLREKKGDLVVEFFYTDKKDNDSKK